MRAPILLLALAVAACGAEQSPEEKAASDAAASAEIRAANVPPPIPVTLEPIAYSDIEANDLIGIGCSFALAREADAAMAVTMVEAAYVKQDNEIQRLAPDMGSAEMPFGTRAHYDGTAFGLEITMRGDGEPIGGETTLYDAALTLRDGRDRIVYQREGVARCGS
ncbi:hypothetical protein A3736_09400 [Erythrobacter sp. HI0063]|jgi:hypothetical protein|uniref:hypothetical protein n=1 Tax=Erythrobacter sp. HI0063 TaxID=1822240 RepID=UPI0007C2C492|nr:hypothetical protein [Erythrobacter sp. HI0063]KZY55811.1 hypothetical protein A3736_09400 [Erythrobacter sp. HI0063]